MLRKAFHIDGTCPTIELHPLGSNYKACRRVVSKHPPATLDAEAQPTTRLDSSSPGSQQILRTIALFACPNGIWGIGKHWRPGPAIDAACWRRTCATRLFAGGGAAGCAFGALDYAAHHRLFRFLWRGLLPALPQFLDGDGASGAVCRGGAVIFAAPRSRLHNVGDPCFSYGA